METPEQERARVARHEAAHVVLSVYFGHPFDFVTIIPEGEKRGRVSYTDGYGKHPTPQQAWECAIIDGAAHEDAHLHQLKPGSGGDIRHAENVLRLAHPDVPDVIPLLVEAWSTARELVRRPEIQAAITALAKALLRKEKIQAKQATAFVRKTMHTFQALNRYDEKGYVAIGGIGLCIYRLSNTRPDGREYEVVTVIGVRPGKRACWLLVRDEAGNTQRVLARHILGEERALQLQRREVVYVESWRDRLSSTVERLTPVV